MRREPIGRSISALQMSRRRVLAGGMGAAALAFAGAGPMRAQDATPEDGSGGEGSYPMFLFVQLAEAGTWLPSADDPEVYELTLMGVGSHTAFFSDRPERIVGTMETDQFLEELGFTPYNPPNAAAVVHTPDGERDVLVIELFDPVFAREFDADGGGTLIYQARVLDAYHGDSLTSWYDEQDNPQLPSQFDQISLFIDDCPGIDQCRLSPWAAPPNAESRDLIKGWIPGGPYPMCFNADQTRCVICEDTATELNELCNNTYPDCNGGCWAV
jgi:hypothetical protein